MYLSIYDNVSEFISHLRPPAKNIYKTISIQTEWRFKQHTKNNLLNNYICFQSPVYVNSNILSWKTKKKKNMYS